MTRTASVIAMAIERARCLRFCSSVRTIRSGFSSMSSPDTSRRRTAEKTTLDQEDGEEDEQIEDREGEQAPGQPRAALTICRDLEAPSQCGHYAAGEERDRPVERIRIAGKPRRRADRQQQNRVEQDLTARLGRPRH